MLLGLDRPNNGPPSFRLKRQCLQFKISPLPSLSFSGCHFSLPNPMPFLKLEGSVSISSSILIRNCVAGLPLWRRCRWYPAMDGEAKLPVRAAAAAAAAFAVRPTVETTSSSTSSTLSSSSSPPGLIRHVQAAFKRHRALGTLSGFSFPCCL